MTKIPPEILEARKTEFPIHPLIQSRWSPRSMSGEEISDATLFSLLEAAKWAPSCYNNQPWRFIYAKKNTPEWKTLFDLMVEFNQSWACNAAALILIVSKKTFDHNGKPSRTHSFDTGAAWMSLALEATFHGLVAHGMEGFDAEKAKKTQKIEDDHALEILVAIGKQAPEEALAEELRKKETPSLRKPLKEIIRKATI